MVGLTTHRTALALTASLLLIAGCYESKFALGPKGQAVFDRAYVGDWGAGGEESKARIIIRNFNDKEYFVEWDTPDQKPQRMSGFLIDVKGASFAHLRELTEDGTIPDKYLVVRVALADGKLSLRQLNDKFFDGKPIESPEQFRKVVEKNLDNDEMYDRDGSMSAVRIPPAATPAEGHS